MYSSTYLCTMATTSARAVHSLMRVPIDWPRTLQLVLFPIRTHPKDRRLEKQPTTTPFIFSYPSFASSHETTITFVLVVFFSYTLCFTRFFVSSFFPNIILFAQTIYPIVLRTNTVIVVVFCHQEREYYSIRKLTMTCPCGGSGRTFSACHRLRGENHSLSVTLNSSPSSSLRYHKNIITLCH